MAVDDGGHGRLTRPSGSARVVREDLVAHHGRKQDECHGVHTGVLITRLLG